MLDGVADAPAIFIMATMGITVTQTSVRNILTRSSGYLHSVASHSLQPYRGCSYGNSLCGAGCYVQHNVFVTKGRPWGDFLEVRRNAAESYLRGFERERNWARQKLGSFGIFMSSSTDPFVPQEGRFGISKSLLEAMLLHPPDSLMLQSHSHRLSDYCPLLRQLAGETRLSCQLTIESDMDRLPGLPPPASTVDRRFEAAARLRDAGLKVVITVAPLLPIDRPEEFLRRIAQVADAVVIDHFIGGDGSDDGRRSMKTALPAAMAQVNAASIDLSYRDAIVRLANSIMPGRVGVGKDGFAGRYLPAPSNAGS